MRTDDFTVSPCYESAREELTQPDSFRTITNYFREKWMRDLGPTATAILIALRARCYHNRKSGELRDEMSVTMAEIADEIGVTSRTVREHLSNNATLKRFVTSQQELTYDERRGGFRNSEKSFKVLMTDPIHPSDEQRMLEIIRRREEEREKGEKTARERAMERAATCGKNFRTLEKSSKPAEKIAERPEESSAHIEDSLDSSSPKFTLTSLPDDSILSSVKSPKIPTWSSLSDEQKTAYVELARQELGESLAVFRHQKAADMTVAQRALSLFQQDCKKVAGGVG